tara:strand:+ start:187 stop:798 length:612 start_codon:yes stop_codon:yes gene_type:complete
MSKIKKPLKDSIILTTYSSLWITGEQHTRNIDGVDTMVTYRPKQFIHTYKNKHMGICTELINLDPFISPQDIMATLVQSMYKHTVNISVVIGAYTEDDVECESHWKNHTMPVLSKKGTSIVQIDVNALAVINVSTMWQLSEKWMSESFTYGKEWTSPRSTHADAFAPDSYLKTATTYSNDGTGYIEYLSPLRPSLFQQELELA